MSEQPDRMDLHEFRASRRRKTDNLLKEDHRDLKRFFALDSAAYRDLTASGFWSSQMGVEDLQYKGNTFVAEFKGPPPEVLAKLGLTED